MKKKYLLLIISIIIIIWLSIFAIDYSRCNNLKQPIFVMGLETTDDGGSGTYLGLGYKVKIRKYISAEYGVQIESVEMHFLGKVIAASISDIISEENSFIATVLENKSNYIVVKPNENEREIKSSDKIVVSHKLNKNGEIYEKGEKVYITYDGIIMETYPASINASKIEIIK